MEKLDKIVTERRDSRRLGRGLAPWFSTLAALVVLPGCAHNKGAKDVTNAANGIQNTANGISNTLNAVNGASDAVQKTLHVGASTSGGQGSLQPAQITPSGPATACMIDEMGDGNNQISLDGGRRGYWYSYVDKAGSNITPPGGTTFVMSPAAGSNGAAFAARFSGQIAAQPVVYAGIGFTLTDPKGAYDASRYTGVSFWAKAAPGTSKNVRVKIPDLNTDPDGHLCSQCFNDFGTNLALSEEWQKYTIRFSDLTQLPGWGAPHVAHITQSALYGMQWQVNSPGTSYDIAVSNISFTGCP